MITATHANDVLDQMSCAGNQIAPLNYNNIDFDGHRHDVNTDAEHVKCGHLCGL